MAVGQSTTKIKIFFAILKFFSYFAENLIDSSMEEYQNNLTLDEYHHYLLEWWMYSERGK